MTKPIDLDELQRIAEAATRGPWRVESGSPKQDIGSVLTTAPIDQNWAAPGATVIAISHVFYPRLASDWAHIAASSPDVVLALIARIRELEAFARQLIHDHVRDVDETEMHAMLEKWGTS